MDEIAFDKLEDWNPRRYGVTRAIVTPDAESLSAESRFFDYLTRMVKQLGNPRDPCPLPDLDSRSLNEWTITLASGETIYGAFWMIESGWKSLQLDMQNERVLYLINHS